MSPPGTQEVRSGPEQSLWNFCPYWDTPRAREDPEGDHSSTNISLLRASLWDFTPWLVITFITRQLRPPAHPPSPVRQPAERSTHSTIIFPAPLRLGVWSGGIWHGENPSSLASDPRCVCLATFSGSHQNETGNTLRGETSFLRLSHHRVSLV
jgi:hypothetical protein